MRLIAILIIFIFASCKTVKKTERSSLQVDKKEVIDYDSIVSHKIDSVAKHYNEIMRDLSADIAFFDDCDTVYVDSVRVVNTVKYVPGKGIDVSGNIKSFKLRESELLKQLDSLSVEYESEIRRRERAEESIKILESNSTTKKKTKSNFWIFILLGYLVSVILPPDRIFSFIKSKVMKYLPIALLFLFSSCGKFSDGTSVWSGGLWIAPVSTGLGALWFGYLTIKSWIKGGTAGYMNDEHGVPRWKEDDKRFPIWETSHFVFFVALLFATIVLIILVNSER